MPSTTLRPASVFGSSGSWGASNGGLGLAGCVSDAADGTYDDDGTIGEDLLFNYTQIVVSHGKTTQFLLRTRVQQIDGGGSMTVRSRVGGSAASHTLMSPASDTFQTFTDDLLSIVNTIAKANAAQFGAQSGNYGPAPNPLRLTDQWADVVYELPIGAFAHNVATWLGPLVAVGLWEIPLLIRAFERRAGRLSPAERIRFALEVATMGRRPLFDRLWRQPVLNE